MIKKSFAPLKLLLAFSLLFSLFFSKADAAAPSDASGWTFFVRIDEGGFGMGESGSFLLCLSETECRIVSLSNIEDAVGAYTYSASGANGTVTMGSIVMTFSFTDDRRGIYGLVRGGATSGGYQLGKFSAVGGTASDLHDSVIDFNGKRGDAPAVKVNYRLLTGEGDTYSKMYGNIPSASNPFAVEQLNNSTTRLYFNDAVLGTGHTHLMFITPTSGLFAYKIGSGKAYEQGSFSLQPAAAPMITRQPSDQYVAHGGTATFTVAASGLQPFSYQWFKDDEAIAGANQSQYVVNSVSPDDGAGYRVVVSNFLGSDQSDEGLLFPLCPTTLGATRHAWFDYTGGTGSVEVAQSDCTWRVINTNDSWITIQSGNNTSGPGTLTFSVSTNNSAVPRTGHLRVGTQLFKVAQQATFAPASFAGLTLRTDMDIELEGSPTNVSVFYATTPGRTNSFYISTLEGVDTNLYSYTYERINETNARAQFFPTETISLTFSNFHSGTFFLTNSATSNSTEGPFYLSQRRGDIGLDGYPDLRWQNATGQLRITYTAGLFQTNDVNTNSFPRWIGLNDFTRDGKLDFVFFTPERVLVATTASSNLIAFRGGTSVNADWRVVTAEDLSGDDYPDILFQHKDGRIAYWQIGGATNYFNRAVPVRNGQPAAAKWVAVSAVDMNGDREEDIVMLNQTTGRLAGWYFNNGDFVNVDFLAGTNSLGTNWLIRASADMDSDGDNDLLWQDKTTGLVRIWYMEGSDKVGEFDIVDPAPDPAWTLVGPK